MSLTFANKDLNIGAINFLHFRSYLDFASPLTYANVFIFFFFLEFQCILFILFLHIEIKGFSGGGGGGGGGGGEARVANPPHQGYTLTISILT